MKLLKEIKYIVIHHSGNSDSFEKIKNLHININGWEDIGYHWLIDRNGKIIKARNEKFIGAHVKGHNKNSLGICLMKNLDKELPTSKQINSLIQLLKIKIKQYSIPIQNILKHNDFPEVAKTCPGKFLDLEKVKRKLSNTKS